MLAYQVLFNYSSIGLVVAGVLASLVSLLQRGSKTSLVCIALGQLCFWSGLPELLYTLGLNLSVYGQTYFVGWVYILSVLATGSAVVANYRQSSYSVALMIGIALATGRIGLVLLPGLAQKDPYCYGGRPFYLTTDNKIKVETCMRSSALGGLFGIVLPAACTIEGKTSKCAVKLLSSRRSSEDTELLKERSINLDQVAEHEIAGLRKMKGSTFSLQLLGTADYDPRLMNNRYIPKAIITDWVEGRTLFKVVQAMKSKKDPKLHQKVACYTEQIFVAGKEMHDRHVVHTDMHWENVMVTPMRKYTDSHGTTCDHIVVIDFGLHENSKDFNRVMRDIMFSGEFGFGEFMTSSGELVPEVKTSLTHNIMSTQERAYTTR